MNPYETLPAKAFWKLAVAAKSMFDIEDLWNPKFRIMPQQKVATYGSCFAQHIGNALQARGFGWHITEPPPAGLTKTNAKLFNYNVFSSRTGNIYTTSLLKQWIDWALGKKEIPEEIWQQGDRYYDPFRPRIEPNGFASADELRLSRQQTLTSFRQSIEKSDYFIFTMGLTESWVNRTGGYEYPMCPGTVAGEFDEHNHIFENQPFPVILHNLTDAISSMKEVNPNLKVLLTVSPVPLTATKSENHVLVATMESKSILRAVAGQVSRNRPFIDYFPSYEIINSPVFKGTFFEPNQRSVNPYGVEFVMDSFFRCLVAKYGEYPKQNSTPQHSVEDEVCEEELLEAFGS